MACSRSTPSPLNAARRPKLRPNFKEEGSGPRRSRRNASPLSKAAHACSHAPRLSRFQKRSTRSRLGLVGSGHGECAKTSPKRKRVNLFSPSPGLMTAAELGTRLAYSRLAGKNAGVSLKSVARSLELGSTSEPGGSRPPLAKKESVQRESAFGPVSTLLVGVHPGPLRGQEE